MNLHGEIQTMPLFDLFQWLEMMRKTGILEIEHEQIVQKVCLRDGLIATVVSPRAHAADPEENVRGILAEMLQWPAGRFVFTETALPEEIAAGSLKLGTQQMMNLLRERTEAQEVGMLPGELTGQPCSPAPDQNKLRLTVIGRLLHDDFKIPVLPTVVNRVMEITRRDNFSLRTLSSVISTDPVLAAQLIRHANSAVYAGAREVDSLPNAIQRLGSQAVTNLVLAISMQSLRSRRDLFQARKAELWKHSLACALMARTIAATLRMERDVAFLCALMMDLGKIVLLSLLQEIMTQEPAWQKTGAETVEAILQTYHPRVGGVVGEKWNLPPAVLETITCHHALAAAKEYRAEAAVSSLSDTLITYCARKARAAAVGQSAGVSTADEAGRLVNVSAAAMLSLSVEQMQLIIERGPECLKFAQEFLV